MSGTHERIPEFDLYGELGMSVDADGDAIDRAWRARVRSIHPDRVPSEVDGEATKNTARANIAHEWLTDPAKRARYDAVRRPIARVDLPVVDPLARSDTRGPSPRPIGSLVWLGLALVSLFVLLATVQVGIGTNALTVGVFALSLILGLYFDLIALFAAFHRAGRA